MTDELDKHNVNTLFNEFGVKNEEELFQELTKDWDIIQCIERGTPTPLASLHIINGDPVCSSCLWERSNE